MTKKPTYWTGVEKLMMGIMVLSLPVWVLIFIVDSLHLLEKYIVLVVHC